MCGDSSRKLAARERRDGKMADLSVPISPDGVPAILREAAQEFYEAQGELESAWQDEGAGQDWGYLARILENAADEADAVIAGEAEALERWKGEPEDDEEGEDDEEDEDGD
jgi:hypothetical protein